MAQTPLIDSLYGVIIYQILNFGAIEFIPNFALWREMAVSAVDVNIDPTEKPMTWSIGAEEG